MGKGDAFGDDDVGTVAVDQLDHLLQIVDGDAFLPKQKFARSDDRFLPAVGFAFQPYQIAIDDVTALIDVLLGSVLANYDPAAADCDRDGSISISDVTTLIDMLLAGV